MPLSLQLGYVPFRQKAYTPITGVPLRDDESEHHVFLVIHETKPPGRTAQMQRARRLALATGSYSRALPHSWCAAGSFILKNPFHIRVRINMFR